MQLGNWQLDTAQGGRFAIDGGSVYGVVPKVLWEKLTPADSLNRVPLAANCVLARDGTRTVLIDTGYGGKHPPRDREMFDMEEDEPLLRSLQRLKVAPEAIDMVVLSHLHDDHAGGATRYDANRSLVPTFPQADYVVGRCEWEDAMSGRAELRTAYPPENLMPLEEAGRVRCVDDGEEIVPGLRALVTGGHTRGHLALRFESGGQVALYPGDICPTTRHLRQLWCLAYDTSLLVTRCRKTAFLRDVAERQHWILWPHDPECVTSRLVAHPKREFEVVEPRQRL